MKPESEIKDLTDSTEKSVMIPKDALARMLLRRYFAIATPEEIEDAAGRCIIVQYPPNRGSPGYFHFTLKAAERTDDTKS